MCLVQGSGRQHVDWSAAKQKDIHYILLTMLFGYVGVLLALKGLHGHLEVMTDKEGAQCGQSQMFYVEHDPFVPTDPHKHEGSTCGY